MKLGYVANQIELFADFVVNSAINFTISVFGGDLLMYRFCAMAIVLSIVDISSVCAQQAQDVDWRKTKEISLKNWYMEVQSLASNYSKKSNKVATEIEFENLVKAIEKDLDGRVIKFKTRVKNVTWKDDVAEIFTLSEYEELEKTSPRAPVNIFRVEPFSVRMDREEAASVKQGDVLSFVGRLRFQPSRWGAVGKATSSQGLYSLRCESLSTNHLGTFTTTEYELTLNGKDLEELWSKP